MALQPDRSSLGMDLNGPSTTSGPPSPGDLIAQQRKDAIQAAAQPPSDAGLFAQLTSNPFFTAVSNFEHHQRKRVLFEGKKVTNAALRDIRDLVSRVWALD